MPYIFNLFSIILGMIVLLLVGCDYKSSDKSETTLTSSHSLVHRSEPLIVEITGSDYQWQLRYPGADGKLGTSDDIHAVRHPHVPVHREMRFQLNSHDYLYTFAIPKLKLNELVVPDLTYTLEFNVDEIGKLEFRGDQFCGYTHPELSGILIVESQEDFEAWLKTKKRK